MNSIGRRHRWSSSEVQNHLGTLSSLPPCGRTGAPRPPALLDEVRQTCLTLHRSVSRTCSTSGTTGVSSRR